LDVNVIEQKCTEFMALKKIKMDLREVGLGAQIDLAQDRYRWRAVVYTVMNLRVP
jgi:hypothetical protein